MNGFSFRMTLTSYWRGIRINGVWDEPEMYPERFISVILGFISFVLVIRDMDRSFLK